MSIVIESTNLQTQNVTKGKLSFVDLAGSERCGPQLDPDGSVVNVAKQQSRVHACAGPYRQEVRMHLFFHRMESHVLEPQAE